MNAQIEGTPVTVGVGSGLTGPGYSFMLSTDTAGIVWEAILDAGAVPMGAAAWEQLRVWDGTKSNIPHRKASAQILIFLGAKLRVHFPY